MGVQQKETYPETLSGFDDAAWPSLLNSQEEYGASPGEGMQRVVIRGTFDLPDLNSNSVITLWPKSLFIQKELDLITVAIGPDVYCLAYVPGPVREDVEYRLVRPPGFEIEEHVLRKTAQVENAGLGSNLRPPEGIRFTAIVKTGPVEYSGQERACCIECETRFEALTCGLSIGCLQVCIRRVILVDTARSP